MKIKLRASFIRHDYSTVPEEEAELEIEPNKTGFIVVDMQNTYCKAGGLLEKRGVDISRAQKIIDPIRRVCNFARQVGIKVVYTQHTHRPGFSDLQRSRREVGVYGLIKDRNLTLSEARELNVEIPYGMPVKGSWFAEIIEELRPKEGDIVIDTKHTYTGFYQTDLELVLRTVGINTLMFGGATASICVGSTLRDAFFRGFRCILLGDCTYEKTDEGQKAAEKLVKMHFGYLSSSLALLESWEQDLALHGDRKERSL